MYLIKALIKNTDCCASQSWTTVSITYRLRDVRQFTGPLSASVSLLSFSECCEEKNKLKYLKHLVCLLPYTCFVNVIIIVYYSSLSISLIMRAFLVSSVRLNLTRYSWIQLSTMYILLFFTAHQRWSWLVYYTFRSESMVDSNSCYYSSFALYYSNFYGPTDHSCHHQQERA